MSLYIITGIGCSGKKTLATMAYDKVKTSPKYCFLRVVSTRPDTSGSLKTESESNHEALISDEEFARHKEANRFFYTWTEQRPKETPIHWAIPGSLSNALADGKKVVLVMPAVHRQVAVELEKLLSIAYPVKTISVNCPIPSILVRIKANPRLLATSASISVTSPNEKGSTSARVQSSDGGNSSSSSSSSTSGSSSSTSSSSTSSSSALSSSSSTSASGSTSSSSSSGSSSSTSSSSSGSSSSHGSASTAGGGGSASGANALIAAALVLTGAKLEERLALIKKKLTKMLSETEPASPQVILIDNDRSPSLACQDMLQAIDFDPEEDFKVPPPAPADLKSCTPQEYLCRTIYPTLIPALQMLDTMRPSDPVEFLAMCMLRDEHMARVQLAQLKKVREAEQNIRNEELANYKDSLEYGRI